MNIYDSFAQSLAFEQGITIEAATDIVQWLSTEGVLNVDMLTETYGEGVRD